MNKKDTSLWLVPGSLLLLGFIVIATGVIRLSAMSEALSTGVIPENTKDMKNYVEYPVISLLHILPGIVFILLGPLQLTSAIRQKWPVFHRWSGCVLIMSGILAGVSAILMAAMFQPTTEIDPMVLRIYISGNITFGFLLVISLIIALRSVLRKDIQKHRSWMIRSYAIGLTPATMRVFMLPLFLWLGKDVMLEYIGLIVWLTFIFQLMVAEMILLRGRRNIVAI